MTKRQRLRIERLRMGTTEFRITEGHNGILHIAAIQYGKPVIWTLTRDGKLA